MKKILTILLLIVSLSVKADDHGWQLADNISRALAILITFAMIIFFVITFLQRILDHRLRNKIVDKGIPEGLAGSLLKDKPRENIQSTIKWFCLLGSTGAGLFIVYYTMPLNIHSLAIMALSISIGFLGYYLFLKQKEK